MALALSFLLLTSLSGLHHLSCTGPSEPPWSFSGAWRPGAGQSRQGRCTPILARTEGPVGRWKRQISSLGPLGLQVPRFPVAGGGCRARPCSAYLKPNPTPSTHKLHPVLPSGFLPPAEAQTSLCSWAEQAERRAGWARACRGRGRGRREPTSRGKAPRSVLQGRPAVWGGQGIVTGMWRGGESREASRTGDISSFPWVGISLPCLHFFRHFWIKGTNS